MHNISCLFCRCNYHLLTSIIACIFILGVGQVYLANDIVAGVLVLVGIMFCSRISALAAFFGSAIGAGVAALVGCNRDAIEGGMYGFNPSLTLTGERSMSFYFRFSFLCNCLVNFVLFLQRC